MPSIEIIKTKLSPVFQKEPIYKAILFGSYAKGNATEKSDIDLVIDSRGELLGLDFYRVLDQIINTLGIDVDLIEASEIIPDSPVDYILKQEGVVIYDREIA